MSLFAVEIFCLTVPKHFVEEPFYAVCQKFSGSKKVYGWKGGGQFQDLPSKIFCLSAEIFRRGTP